ncbi:hypothetical protein S83_019524, partial [Arachis hypogaea]
GLKHSEQGVSADAVALGGDIWKASERESLEASIKAVFEAIGSRRTNSHVVPSHCDIKLEENKSCSIESRGGQWHLMNHLQQVIINLTLLKLARSHPYFYVNIPNGSDSSLINFEFPWSCNMNGKKGIELIAQSFYVKQYHGGTNFGRTTGGPFVAT